MAPFTIPVAYLTRLAVLLGFAIVLITKFILDVFHARRYMRQLQKMGLVSILARRKKTQSTKHSAANASP